MKFSDLDKETKESFHKQLLENAINVGGKNYFLKMLEDLRKQKPHALLRKSANGYYERGKISWGKEIYKDTMELLFNAMRKEERDGDMLQGLPPKEYKTTMNMMKILKPIEITFTPDNEKSKGFSLTILDTSVPKKTKVSLMYKTIFFYSIDFAKDALSYQIEE
jgi:hypothetical protein